ncbi:MAG: hypothetical protein DRP82_04310 [Planctomycetota bacterium]|nr:MAG: hypothetical protein DRP82_04310 [Planctomycetota bacterium]
MCICGAFFRSAALAEVHMKVLICGAFLDDGSPLWADFYDAKTLQRIRSDMGPILFAMQYQNDTSLAEGNYFRREWIRFWSELPDGLRFYAGVDLAAGPSSRHDKFAVVVVGTDGQNFYVADAVCGRFTLERQVEAVIGVWRRWGVVSVGIESVAYQRVFADFLGRRGLPVKRLSQTQNRRWRMARLASHIEAGRLIFCAAHTELIEQVLLWPLCKHDDLLDALEMALRVAHRPGGELLSISGI